MLILIDQSKPAYLRFRCSECQAEGISNHTRSADGFFLDLQVDPPRWVHHECAEPEETAAPPKKARKAKALTA